MEGTGARKLKKAVVSLQKLDISFQGSSFLSREMLTDSGGNENPLVDNIGCTDDDDLEKKIQAFSIPVKPDELPTSASKCFKKPNAKDSISVGKKLTDFKSDKTQHSSSTSTKAKDKVSHGKISSESEKQHSKIVSDKEKLSQGKAAKDKVSSDLHKISSTKDQEVKKPKSEQEKSSRQDDAGSKEKSLKRKSSVDHKSREPQEKLIKFEKKEKQSDRDKPSSSSTKSNTSHSKSLDSKGHSKTVPLKKETKHDENKDKSNSSKIKVNKDGEHVERKSHKMKEGVKEVKKTNKDLKKEDKTIQSTTTKVIDSKSGSKNNEKSVLSDPKKKPILRRQSSSNSLIEKKKLKVHSESSSESNKKDTKKEAGSNGKVVSKQIVSDVNKKEGKVLKKLANNDRNGRRNDVKEKTGRNDTENQIKNGKVIKKSLSTNSSHLKKVSGLREEKKSSSHKFEKLEGQKNFDRKKHGSERNEKSRERKGEGAVKQKRNNKKSVSSSGKRKAFVNPEDTLNYEGEELQPKDLLTERLLLSKPLFKKFSNKADRFPSRNVGTEAYKKIWKWSHYIRMPSDKWSLHKHPKGDFVIILHVSEINPLSKIIIDKHVMFCKTALPVVKLYDKEVSTLQTAKELLTLGEVCAFLKNIDNLSVCESLRKSIVVGSNGKCGLYTSSKVTLPYTCQHCSRMKASVV